MNDYVIPFPGNGHTGYAWRYRRLLSLRLYHQWSFGRGRKTYRFLRSLCTTTHQENEKHEACSEQGESNGQFLHEFPLEMFLAVQEESNGAIVCKLHRHPLLEHTLCHLYAPTP